MVTRQEVIDKLETIKDLTQPEMLEIMTAWSIEIGSEKLVDDLLSYSVYADAPKE